LEGFFSSFRTLFVFYVLQHQVNSLSAPPQLLQRCVCRLRMAQPPRRARCRFFKPCAAGDCEWLFIPSPIFPSHTHRYTPCSRRSLWPPAPPPLPPPQLHHPARAVGRRLQAAQSLTLGAAALATRGAGCARPWRL
jgi:hypothetical protein